MALNDLHDFGNVRSSDFAIRGGQKMKLSVDVQELSASERLREFSLESRQCMFPHEVKEDSIFKVQSTTLCLQFEPASKNLDLHSSQLFDGMSHKMVSQSNWLHSMELHANCSKC